MGPEVVVKDAYVPLTSKSCRTQYLTKDLRGINLKNACVESFGMST